ncbi:MAG: hypothetical protein ACLQJR_34590 [Stellaceae bacterium]
MTPPKMTNAVATYFNNRAWEILITLEEQGRDAALPLIEELHDQTGRIRYAKEIREENRRLRRANGTTRRRRAA